MKKILLVCIMIMLMLASACGNVEMTSNPNTSNEPKPETDESIIPKNTSVYCAQESMNLDSETEKNFYGTWKVEKLLGFANSYNDASEYPTGQKFIGDEIIIKKDFFSSKDLKTIVFINMNQKTHYMRLQRHVITLTLFIDYIK